MEGVILGIVASRKGCTAYDILKRFERSPVHGWSASQGAIYPAVARLKRRAFLVASGSAGPRKSERLEVTEDGGRALRGWTLTVAPEMGGAPVDPIRTRLNYIFDLGPDEVGGFLEEAERVTAEALESVRTFSPDPLASNRFQMALTAMGVEYQLEAKLRWLRTIRVALVDKI